MPLTAGTRLGAYEIFSLLGAGSMGEVYRALDRQLGREVAIKVLPPAFSQNADRLARFEREARLLAALNHPNIATIHGVEDADGVRFLILELVAGKTLSERLGRTPLPIREALEIGRQVAEGLASAHEKGVIHRDLKPSNVQVTPEGRVKVLDFGLAKESSLGGEEAGRSESPTGTGAGTHDGVILGTAPYMSPEQARGQELDKRTDIWSFGCLLYEMLTATRAFGGGTVSDTIAAVLEREPDWGKLPPTTPAAVASLLRRCLQKDRLRRLHDIADARIEIEEVLAGFSSSPSAAVTQTAARSRSSWRRDAALVGSALVAFGLAAWGARMVQRSRSPAPSSLTRLSIQLPTGVILARIAPLAVAPDGSSVVFTGFLEDRPQLYLRRMDQISAAPIAGTQGGDTPFFSPDGQWLGFWAEGKLKKVPLSGGEPKTICDAPNLRGASWGPDDTILFAGAGDTGLSLVAAAGGTPRALTTPDRQHNEVSHRWPQFLPGGRAAVFSTGSSSGREEERNVAVVALDTGGWRVLLKGGSSPRYVATGHLLYGFQAALWAVPLDLEKQTVTGPAVRVLEDVRMDSGASGSVSAEVARGGALVYLPYPGPSDNLLQWVDRQGKSELVTSVHRPYTNARLSPDGHRVAVVLGYDDLSVYDLTRETWTRLSSNARVDSPVWSPDGKRVAFSSDRNGAWNLFWTAADGTGAIEQLTRGPLWSNPTSFAPDGSVIAFTRNRQGRDVDIDLLPLAGDRATHPFLATPAIEQAAALSPNGRWIAYQSDETGRDEVYVRPYPGPGPKRTMSTNGGYEPRWTGDRELVYLQGAGKVMAVAVRMAPQFEAETPRLLFEFPFEPQDFDAVPATQRFIAVQVPKEATPSEQLVVIPDWLAGMERRLQTARR